MRICEHVTVTLDEFRKIPAFTQLQRFVRLCSGIPDQVLCGHLNHKHGRFSRVPEVKPTRNHVSRIECLLRVRYDRRLTAWMIKEALIKRAVYICPHLTSDSERAIPLLMQWSWQVEKGPDMRMQDGVDLRPQFGGIGVQCNRKVSWARLFHSILYWRVTAPAKLEHLDRLRVW